MFQDKIINFYNILEEIIIKNNQYYNKTNKLSSNLFLRTELYFNEFGTIDLVYLKDNKVSEFWNDIELNLDKKVLNIYNFHRLIEPKRKGIGSFILKNLEENFKQLAFKYNCKLNIEFLSISKQKDTINFLTKFGYKLKYINDKNKIYYKEFNL